MDSISNESPNKVLQDAHAYYWAQFPYWGRAPVCRSIRAVAVCSERVVSATPSKASWSQFESVNNGWHLKLKPSPSPSKFTLSFLPFNEQVIVQQGSEGQTGVHRCTCLNHLEVARGQPSNANWPWSRRWAYQTIAPLIVFMIHIDFRGPAAVLVVLHEHLALAVTGDLPTTQ